ncbi:MAG: thioredoxin [Candidatus Melainabacteria bacterium RIFCSPHIGHO2_02_FULL_34_12]|nr:MAG: thioredoxin [Candidatus Melainabacteria bacterium RIFCSPHIGHO2_02_FULL_34_12]
MSETVNKKANKLINEKSPYLLQHAYNPVNWYSWCEEAFEKAKKENKPIFLSIGYSTCHWCHVMEKESFEDDEVAELMNKYFISIKVDREERPDIDGIYMTVCQIMTGSGGWPLTVFLTPEKKPFFAGTYFPKENRYGRIGMKGLLPSITDVWQNKKEDVNESTNQMINILNQVSSFPSGSVIEENIFENAYAYLKRQFDPESGGFGTAPKFPTAHNLLFLLRYWKHKGDDEVLHMVEKTLQSMRNGGIYDHIGFGFHRYSTDSKWLVPHFEKMLYDQAMIAMSYIEAFQATHNPVYKKITEEIFEYISRDMTSDEGGFYCALDADSEGEEGKFYVWSYEEIVSVLEKDELELAVKIFNVEKKGNYLEEATREKTRMNILHLKNTISEDEEELYEKIEKIRQKLFTARKKRIHPLKDDKILVSWNGLMIAALSKAASVFENSKYLSLAENAVKFIFKDLVNEKGNLFHSFRNGKSQVLANTDDYSCLVWGLLELYEATFNVNYLKSAIELNEYLIKHFWDEHTGGFYFTSDIQEKLIVRHKEIYDGAMPSGNSVALMNLIRLAKITGNKRYDEYIANLEKAISENVKQSPISHTWFLSAIAFVRWKPLEIIVTGDLNSQETKNILNEIKKHYLPNSVLLFKSINDESKNIDSVSDFTAKCQSLDGKTTVYVCENFACKSPITEVENLLF